jgi:dipeptidyl aminopeptidase/acylaminoacyl peptidase
MELAQQVLRAAVPTDPVLRADGTAVACTVTRADLDADRWDRRVRVGDTESAGPADRHPRWSPVGDTLAFIRPDARGIDQVVRWPDGAALTASDHAVRQFTWSPDGTALALLVTMPSPARSAASGTPLVTSSPAYLRDGEGRELSTTALDVVDLASGDVRRLVEPRRAIGDIAWLDTATLAFTAPFDDRQWRWDVWQVDLDGTVVARTDHGPWERAACPVVLADGSLLYAGGESGPEHTVLMTDSPPSGRRRVFPDLDRNITIGMPAYPGARPSVDGATVWCTANDRGVSRLWSGSFGDAAPIAHTPLTTVVTGVDARAGQVVVTEATVDSPGRLRRIGDTTAWPSDTVDVPWTAEELDGPVPCWLLRSRHASGTGPAPLLVDLHGGPHNVSNGVLGPGNLHRLHLARAGWHVLLPNYRGSDGYGTDWYRGLEPSGGWCSDDVLDVLHAVDAAVAAGIGDASRLTVTGYSYGGLLTAALTATDHRFRAAALGGAPVDLRAFSASSDMGPVLCTREVGDPEAADRRSPIRRVGDVRTPTLVFHGADDQRVPVAQADQWYQGLVHAGVPCELAVYPGMAHGFVTAGPPNKVLDIGARIADWLQKWTTP